MNYLLIIIIIIITISITIKMKIRGRYTDPLFTIVIIRYPNIYFLMILE